MCGQQAGKAAKKVKAESESEDMSGSEEEFNVKPKVYKLKTFSLIPHIHSM